MSIVKIRDKRIGVTYVYEQEKSVWDPVKKQARSKRTLIGKLDEESGEIVPTNHWGKNRRSSSGKESAYKQLYVEIKAENRQLKKDLATIRLESQLLKSKIAEMNSNQEYNKRAPRLTYHSPKVLITNTYIQSI